MNWTGLNDWSHMPDDLMQRTKLRASEERRVTHAYEVLTELIAKHNLDERDGAELYAIYQRVKHAIKNQHIANNEYAAYRKERDIPEGF